MIKQGQKPSGAHTYNFFKQDRINNKLDGFISQDHIFLTVDGRLKSLRRIGEELYSTEQLLLTLHIKLDKRRVGKVYRLKRLFPLLFPPGNKCRTPIIEKMKIVGKKDQ